MGAGLALKISDRNFQGARGITCRVRTAHLPLVLSCELGEEMSRNEMLHKLRSITHSVTTHFFAATHRRTSLDINANRRIVSPLASVFEICGEFYHRFLALQNRVSTTRRFASTSLSVIKTVQSKHFGSPDGLHEMLGKLAQERVFLATGSA